LYTAAANAVAAAAGANAQALPQNSPFASVNAQKVDEVARTVYVGNLNSKITPDQLVKFFCCMWPRFFLSYGWR